MEKKRVLVAMSGGVDSSVAARLLVVPLCVSIPLRINLVHDYHKGAAQMTISTTLERFVKFLVFDTT